MCHTNHEKRKKKKKKKTTEGIELPNQESISTLGEEENYKYLGVLEADSTKQTEIKEKNVKRNQHLGSRLCKILWTVLKTSKGGS